MGSMTGWVSLLHPPPFPFPLLPFLGAGPGGGVLCLPAPSLQGVAATAGGWPSSCASSLSLLPLAWVGSPPLAPLLFPRLSFYLALCLAARVSCDDLVDRTALASDR